MSKTKDLFEERINREKAIHEKLLKKEMENLNERIKSDRYNIDNMLLKSGIGYAYHDLINSKDKLNTNYQSKFNQTYHAIDVELYKLNKIIDGKTRMVNYKYHDKKDKVVHKILSEIM
ncbi:MAG: hypothetical protein BZ135_04380 [Methanosphaera sp. rholeuAM6]|nr:MAG: hypothetical protein BZ135_04380 [Methanosphaera sp. rholeuAM6]